jgi:hypothetical protein
MIESQWDAASGLCCLCQFTGRKHKIIEVQLACNKEMGLQVNAEETK